MSRGRSDASSDIMIRLEDVQTLEFLVQDSQGLELLRLEHLLLKPVFDLILLFLFNLFVCVIQMPVQLQQRDHLLIAYRTHQAVSRSCCRRGKVWPAMIERDSTGNILRI